MLSIPWEAEILLSVYDANCLDSSSMSELVHEQASSVQGYLSLQNITKCFKKTWFWASLL